MANFIWAVGASIAVSLVSLIGIFSLLFREKWFNKILFLLIGTIRSHKLVFQQK